MTQGGKRDILMKPACSDKGCELFLFLELFLWMLRITVLVGRLAFPIRSTLFEEKPHEMSCKGHKDEQHWHLSSGLTVCVCVCMCVIRDKKKQLPEKLPQIEYFICPAQLTVIFIYLYFLFILFFRLVAWYVESQFPDQTLNPCHLHWELRVLTTESPGKSPQVIFNLI